MSSAKMPKKMQKTPSPRARSEISAAARTIIPPRPETRSVGRDNGSQRSALRGIRNASASASLPPYGPQNGPSAPRGSSRGASPKSLHHNASLPSEPHHFAQDAQARLSKEASTQKSRRHTQPSASGLRGQLDRIRKPTGCLALPRYRSR